MKKVTIHHTLFASFSIIILISFLSIAAIFFFFEMPKQMEQTVSVLGQNCSSIAQSADKEMEQIRSTAMNIAHSSLVQNELLGESMFRRKPMTTEEKALMQTFLSVLITPNDKSDQVNMYLPNGEIIGTGRINSVRFGNAKDQQWYGQVIDRPYHNAFVYMGEDDAMGKYSTGFYSKHFISYVMQQFDNLNLANGYIEIKRSMESVLTSAIHYNSVYGEEVYIVDGSGTLVFPVETELPQHLAELTAEGLPETAGLHLEDGHYVFYTPSEYSDFCTLLTISRWELMSPVFFSMGNIIVIAVITLALAVVLSYVASRRVSQPIRQMCDEVTAFDLTNPLPQKGLQTDVAELESLYLSFSDMREKLIDSMNAQLLLQNQEMQSRMLALQAQMNPHFLYNSLAVIQAMSDENMNEEIAQMCQTMSDILRYISSDTDQEVSLQEEISHVNNYLRCMAIRYQEDLTYTVEIPEEMNKVKVPKLCIQLLVENAIKFSATGRPPYHIRITALQDDQHHEISVRDIGPGFSQEALEILNRKMAEIDASGLLPSLEIDGMGLLNIYIRYKLLHRGKLIFRLENQQPRGACVTIGEYYG